MDRYSRYEGYEIPARIRLKEHLAAAGEQNMLEHRETHVTIRPYSENYRGQPGYTEDGLRTAQQMTMKIFKDGEQNTAWSKVQNAPIYGDYAYGRRPKGKRLQAEIEMTSSAFRITKVRQLHENCDERVGPAYAVSSESNWQREFATPDLWLVRSRTNPLRNRGTGQDVTATYSGLVTGPDGVAQSALLFPAAGGIATTLADIVDGSLFVWLGNMGTVGNVWVFPQFTVSIVQIGTAFYVQIVGAGLTITQALNWNAVDWVHLGITIDSAYIRIYENGVQRSTAVRPAGLTVFGGALNAVQNMLVSAFDIKRIPRVVSTSAIAYYYDNVVNSGGNILPMQR
jgi:hypothetical protein